MSAKRILVVDDEPLVGMVACKQLVAAGFEDCKSIVDPSLAIGEVEESGINLVLLDISMPNLSGLEILRQLRCRDEFADVKVVILSAAGKNERETAMELGADGFISKPVTGKTLIGEVQRILECK